MKKKLTKSMMSLQEQTHNQELTDEQLQGMYELILHNDDEHTFDFVIDTLIRFCRHTEEQAEQCALITHEKGACQVKIGPKEKMTHLRSKISETGLIVEAKKMG